MSEVGIGVAKADRVCMLSLGHGILSQPFVEVEMVQKFVGVQGGFINFLWLGLGQQGHVACGVTFLSAI